MSETVAMVTSDQELEACEVRLRRLEQGRAAAIDKPGSDYEIEPNDVERNALEERMLAMRATNPVGFAVKVRRAEKYLDFPSLAGRWLESLRADLEN